MKNKIQIKHLILASYLAAFSIVIDASVKAILGVQTFGLPFHNIPIIYASIVLGPIYGVGIALVGDVLGLLLAGHIVYFAPWFMLAPIAWGLIPGLFLHKKINKRNVILVIGITHLVATIANTFGLVLNDLIQTHGLFEYSWRDATVLPTIIGGLIRRIPIFFLILPNAYILSLVTIRLHERLQPFQVDLITSPTKQVSEIN
ncbi:MAG: folate family ECF transporter S component [Acholeplasmataceae bacterium]